MSNAMWMCRVFGHRLRSTLVIPGGEVDTSFRADDFAIEALAHGLDAQTVREACTRCGHVESVRERRSEPRQAVANRVRVLAPLETPVEPVAVQPAANLVVLDQSTEYLDVVGRVGDAQWPEDVPDAHDSSGLIGCEWWQKDKIETMTYDRETSEFIDGRQPCTGRLVKTYPSGQYVCSNGDNHWSR